MNGGPKDNANPVIRDVERRRRSSKKPVGWHELRTFVGSGGDEDQTQISFDIENSVPTGAGVNPIARSRVDQTVLQALSDVSRLTSGEGVGLLKRVGWKFPTEASSPASLGTVRLLRETRLDASDTPAMEVDGEEEAKRDRLDAEEIFDIIRNIQDPEHPLTLEQLGVVSCEQIEVRDVLDSPSEADDGGSFVNVRFTPTIPGCSMATLIGLAIKVKLQRSLPPRFKVAVRIESGTHQSEHSINKQLSDKERVCAALENPHLFKVVNRCIHNGMTGNMS